MLKFASLAALVIFAEAGAKMLCTEGQIQRKGECLEDCKAERFDNCGEKGKSEEGSVFCALDRHGNWRQFTKECQPCKLGFVGVREGKCKESQKAQKKQPQQQPQQKKRAVKTFSCPNVKTNDDCPQTSNEQVCGFDVYHQFKNFKSWCHACKEPKTKRYVTQPCDEFKKNVEQKKTEAAEQKDKCGSKTCGQWQICRERTCVDKCEVMRCPGGCKEGKCLPRKSN